MNVYMYFCMDVAMYLCMDVYIASIIRAQQREIRIHRELLLRASERRLERQALVRDAEEHIT